MDPPAIIILGFAALLASILWVRWRDPKRGQDVTWQAVVALFATFLGVFLASRVALRDQESATEANLLRVVRVARVEAAESLSLLEQLATEHSASILFDDRRLTLERPAASLETLVDMASFLEYGDEEIVPELVALSTKLVWTTASFRKTGPPGGARLFTPPVLGVIDKR